MFSMHSNGRRRHWNEKLWRNPVYILSGNSFTVLYWRFQRCGWLLQRLLFLRHKEMWILPSFCFNCKKIVSHIEQASTRILTFLMQSHHSMHGISALNNGDNGYNGMGNSPNQLDAAIWFINFPYLNHVALAISNNALYKMQKDWTAFAKYALHTDMMPALFQHIRSSVVIMFGLTRTVRAKILAIYVAREASEMFNTDIIIFEELPGSCHALNMTIAVPMRKREDRSRWQSRPEHILWTLQLRLKQHSWRTQTCLTLPKLGSLAFFTRVGGCPWNNAAGNDNSQMCLRWRFPKSTRDALILRQ